MTKEEYWFWLCTLPDLYRDNIKKILNIYGTPEAVYASEADELFQKNLITLKQKQGMEKSKASSAFLDRLGKLKKEGIRFICPDSEDYPEKLKEIPDAPFSLYVKGKLPDPILPSVGMVGARRCSEYGSAMATRFSRYLGQNNVQVISGMAIGIDSISAKGALEGGGKTFAVLGSGVDVIYPIQNFSLYYEIIASGGGIISEYPPGSPAVAWQFPARNRIISGLSDILTVFEAKKRSGTLITVRYALDQGRDVYALPGRLTDKSSEGCNEMIADGAGILLSPEQFLVDLCEAKAAFLKKEKELKPEQKRAEKSLKTEEAKIYALLDYTPVSVQALIKQSGLSAERTSVILTELELSGQIREVSKNQYVKTV